MAGCPLTLNSAPNGVNRPARANVASGSLAVVSISPIGTGGSASIGSRTAS